MKGCRTGSSHFGVYGVWLEVGLDGLSESAGVQQTSGDAVVEVAEAEGYAPLRVSSLPLMASVGLFAPLGWSKNARMSAMRRLKVRPSVTSPGHPGADCFCSIGS